MSTQHPNDTILLNAETQLHQLQKQMKRLGAEIDVATQLAEARFPDPDKCIRVNRNGKFDYVIPPDEIEKRFGPGENNAAKQHVIEARNAYLSACHAINEEVGLSMLEERYEALQVEEDKLEIIIVETPADAVAGVAVKLRLFRSWLAFEYSDGIPDDNDADFSDRIALSAWHDVERLASAGAA